MLRDRVWATGLGFVVNDLLLCLLLVIGIQSIRAQRHLSPLLLLLPISLSLFFADNLWCCLFRILTHAFTQHSIKSGKVVVLLNGRYAGRKAVVVRSYESGNAGEFCVYGVRGPPSCGCCSCFCIGRCEVDNYTLLTPVLLLHSQSQIESSPMCWWLASIVTQGK